MLNDLSATHRFTIGQRVHKIKGYRFEGTVQSLGVKRDGAPFYVVEHDDGWLFIFREHEVELTP